ncbi:MAG: 23S rRNA pseudouridine(1911/1915/1917) synthase RluD [Steroidobacteraceae bacterium]
MTFEHRLELPPSPGGTRLDLALAAALPQYSRSRLAGWIRDGAVTVNGRPARPRDEVFGGESVMVRGEAPPDDSVRAESIALQVAYRDRHLFVIDKPAGLVVHPGAGNRDGTLQNALLALDSTLATVPRAGIVHRIDKDTSGLLVVARTLEAHTALVRMLKDHDVQREYLALCVGALTGGGTIDKAIGRHRTDRLKMAVRADGREAVTHYRLAERFAAHTLLSVQLETGRTHQIRVHLAHIGHPLVGDPLYGGRRQLTAGTGAVQRAALTAFGRQALHAARLAFVHPVTGREVEVQSPLPADFAALLAALRTP